MASFELGIARSATSELVVQTLPDGSMALFEVETKNVYSLNASAAAAWEACATPTTLPRLAAAMSRRLSKPVTEDLAHEAVSELVTAGLVTVTPGERLGTSRRELLKQTAEVAIPLVLVLTAAEQRAHAQGAGSNPTTTTLPPTTLSPTSTTTLAPTSTTTLAPTSTTTLAPTTTTIAPDRTRIFQIFKFIAASSSAVVDRVPLVGAEFDVVNVATGQVVAHLITGANGSATAPLIPGVQYRLVETFAPPALSAYTPFAPITFTMGNPDFFGFDLNNVPLPPTGG